MYAVPNFYIHNIKNYCFKKKNLKKKSNITVKFLGETCKNRTWLPNEVKLISPIQLLPKTKTR